MSSNPSPRIGKVTVHLWNMKYSCHLLLCPCVYIITGVTSCQCIGNLLIHVQMYISILLVVYCLSLISTENTMATFVSYERENGEWILVYQLRFTTAEESGSSW